MQRDDAISKHLQRLSSIYDTAINDPLVHPALRIQQVKNDRRLAGYHSNETSDTAILIKGAQSDTMPSLVNPPSEIEPIPPVFEGNGLG
jgi:hypothetical protein